ncbi:MAG TPA: S1 RNA-binding domain-containing protein, partial [Syntrophales bacterium]|nr:S1 RNA-binding domain-containing protein [Syntrophales bacterium]
MEEQDREAAEEQAAAKKEDEVGFSALYEQSLQELRSGEIVIGRVVQVSADMVMVDVGSKTEGMIPAREL